MRLAAALFLLIADQSLVPPRLMMVVLIIILTRWVMLARLARARPLALTREPQPGGLSHTWSSLSPSASVTSAGGCPENGGHDRRALRF